MPKLLNEDAITQLNRDGYYFPVKILDEEQAEACRARLEEFETAQGKPVEGAQRNKCHLLFKWIDDLMHMADMSKLNKRYFVIFIHGVKCI